MMVQEVWVYELYCVREINARCDICCTPLKKEYFEEYMRIYNECFYDMRKELDITPYNWYSQYSQIEDKASNIFVLLEEHRIIGSVACYENEIDDLIVERSHQNQGYGKMLLLWAVNHIRQSSDSEITLHVAEWNMRALTLYKNAGFIVCKRERVT